jgi:putative Mg2+ transporter-C (MgtC) family protein
MQLLGGLSCMRGNSHVQFLGEDAPVTACPYPLIAGNTALRPIVNAINRTPFNAQSTEATYQLIIITSPDKAAHTREHVIETLRGANYPISQIQIGNFPQGSVTIIATLYSTSVDPAEMDRILENIRSLECVYDVALMSGIGE